MIDVAEFEKKMVDHALVAFSEQGLPFSAQQRADNARHYHVGLVRMLGAAIEGRALFPSAGADKALANAERYDAAMDELEFSANGDDYNAIINLLRGHDYAPPHTKGR